MASTYLLNMGGQLQQISSSSSIGMNKVIRRLKPPEDRLVDGIFRCDDGDYEEWKVVNTRHVVQELPEGGFEDATILDLERINVPVIPFERRIHIGG